MLYEFRIHCIASVGLFMIRISRHLFKALEIWVGR
jgi:hypothetical protein